MFERFSEKLRKRRLKIGRTFSKDGIKYRIIEADDDVGYYEAEVIGSSANITEASVPDRIDGFQIRSICGPAFSERGSLRSVTLTDGLTEIGYAAFAGCGSLGSVVLPESLLQIGSDAFRGCGSLERISIPNGVMFIGEHAFDHGFFDTHRNQLTDPGDIAGHSYELKHGRFIMISEEEPDHGTAVSLSSHDRFEAEGFVFEITSGPSDMIEIVKYNGHVSGLSIPHTIKGYEVRTIGPGAFEGCTSLRSINIPGTVTEIKERAFSGCGSLKFISIPDSVTRVEDGAFRDCGSLVYVKMSGNLTELGSSAFSGCGSMLSVKIPDGVRSIGGYAFHGCPNLVSVSLPGTVTDIGEKAFDHGFFDTRGNELTDAGDISGRSYGLKHGRYIEQTGCTGESDPSDIMPKYCTSDRIGLSGTDETSDSEKPEDRENTKNRICAVPDVDVRGSDSIVPVRDEESD